MNPPRHAFPVLALYRDTFTAIRRPRRTFILAFPRAADGRRRSFSRVATRFRGQAVLGRLELSQLVPWTRVGSPVLALPSPRSTAADARLPPMAAAAAACLRGQEATSHRSSHRQCRRTRWAAAMPANQSTVVAGRHWPEAGPALLPPLLSAVETRKKKRGSRCTFSPWMTSGPSETVGPTCQVK
jgi:hypothetical protein